MTESMQFHSTPRGPGRMYQCPDDLQIKYGELQPIIEKMKPILKGFLKLETSVRMVLDGERSNSVTSVISVPFEGDDDKIYENLGLIIFQQLWGYYLSADPKSTHHGLTNLVFDGSETSLIRRETEKFMSLLRYRNDLAARVMQDYRMACEMDPFQRDNYLREVTEKVLDVHLGVRMYTYGEGVNRTTLFLPISAGAEAIERIYYNVEHIIHQNLVAYDEVHDHYLPVSEGLICRELEGVLERARLKGNTRKKIIDGLTMNTVLMEDPTMIHHISLADLYYDKFNRIDLLDEAAARSRDLFNTALIRSAEVANTVTAVEKLKLDDRVYIERPEAVGEPAQETVSARPAARPQRQARQAEPEPPKEEEAKEPVTVHKDGLEEL